MVCRRRGLMKMNVSASESPGRGVAEGSGGGGQQEQGVETRTVGPPYSRVNKYCATYYILRT